MLWVKTFHIVLVTSWFAGLFYLPRIFVNLAQETDETARHRLLGMARRLYRFMHPLAILAIALGLWLWLGYGIGKGQYWMHAKLFIVLLLLIYHVLCGRILHTAQNKRRMHPHTVYRWFNEIPVVLLVLAVIFVVIKPF